MYLNKYLTFSFNLHVHVVYFLSKMFIDYVRYYFHILKYCDLLNFGDWQVLIWGISGHVPLSMRIMAHFILANGYQNTIFAKFNSLQNFPLYGKLVINVHVCVHACTCTCTYM